MKNITILSFAVFLFLSTAYAADDTLINSNQTWKYLVTGIAPANSWKNKNFNDAAWPTGTAQLGYGDGDESTVVNYGIDPNNKYITTYFRKSITVSNPSQYTSLTLQLLRDDGARVFLNGKSIARSNLPPGTISYTTLAKNNQGTLNENKYFIFSISPSLLLTGTNVIAVEVHQYNVTSDDLGFDLRLIGSFVSCLAPDGLVSSNITETSAQLDWNAAGGASGYNVQYRIVGAGSWTAATAPSNTLNISSLLPATDYEWQVQTVCGVDSSAFSSLSNFITLAPPPCDAPTGLSVGAVTSSSSALSWTPASGAASYTVQYRTIGNSWSSVSSATASITLTGLTAARTYECNVQTVCAASVSNFSVSSSFTTLQGGAMSDSLVLTNDSWKYLDNGTDQGTAWRDASFNDASWASGNAELGYGDGDEATMVGYGPSSSAKYITTYFRKTFNVTNPSTYDYIALNIVRDDGAIVYINGTEVFRTNMPSGTVNYNTVASAGIGGGDESTWQNTTLTPSQLAAGANVVAVEIHQNAGTSSDISFKLRLTGMNNAGTVTTQRGPYLQMLTPTSIHIRWKTDIATDSRVRYGTDMSYGTTVDSSAAVTEHEIKISGLTPGTKYYYTIGSSAKDLQGDMNNYFKTSLPTGSTAPFRVWAIGDFGNGSANQDAVRNAYTTYAGSNPANLWIWLGDNAYTTGTETEFTNYVFAKYPSIMKNTPLYPGIGNHDYGNAGYQTAATLGINFPYFNLFTCPQNAEAGGTVSGTEKYYSYNYGNAHFIALDSYGSYNTTSSPMYLWLQGDLAANTQRWTVVYFHHPPYTMGTHNSDNDQELINMRQNIVPLLETYKVDLVLCGHSHVYERSMLINGHYGLENSLTTGMKIDAGSGNAPYYIKSSPGFTGTVYTVCGVSGQGGNTTAQGSWPHAAMYSYAKTLYGSMVVDFDNDTISAKFLTSTGTIYDQFKIVKSGSSRFINTSGVYDIKEEVMVYPNPFTDNAVIKYKLDSASPVTIEIIDVAGRIVYSVQDAFQTKGMHDVHLTKEMMQGKTGIFIVRVITDTKVMNGLMERR